MRRQVASWVALMAIAAGSAGCGGRTPDDLGLRADGALPPCPDSPNCVSSQATDPRHAIPPLAIEGDPEVAWEALIEDLEARPRVEIVEHGIDYLHAVFTTRLMRYRDDVELALRRDSGEIDVRSASRVGHGDMGANRDRVESLRAALAERGVVLPAGGD